MRWFEPSLRKVLCEAGGSGLRIGVIVRNVCNMEPSLFGVKHPYAQAYGEIYRFLRSECAKQWSPYCYQSGCFIIDKDKLDSDLQTKLDL